MALTDSLVAQWDVNTRGRADNDFYDHVNGVAESTVGSPSLTYGSGGGRGLIYDGSTNYTILTHPSGLATNFVDNDYTLAVRARQLSAGSGFRWIFGVSDNGDDRCFIGTEDVTAGELYAQNFPNDIASPSFLYTSFALGTSTEYVLVLRKRATTLSTAIFADADSKANDTVNDAENTTAVFNEWLFGRRPNYGDWDWNGEIYWAAAWTRAISDTELGLLDDTHNPFYSPGIQVFRTIT